MRDIANRAPRNYELMTILHPEVTEEELPGAIEQVAGYVTAADGTIEETLRESPWGRRRLAYPIRHGGRDLRDGYYTVYHLHLAPNRVEEVERELKLNERVMRYLMTSYEPIPVDPKVLEQREIDAEDAAAAAYVAAATAAAAAASAEAETAAAVLEANSDATDAPATVAANEAVDLPVDTESARIADEAEAVAESTADAVDVTTAAEADLAAPPAETSDEAATAEAGTGASADEATDASAGAGAAPTAAGDQG